MKKEKKVKISRRLIRTRGEGRGVVMKRRKKFYPVLLCSHTEIGANKVADGHSGLPKPYYSTGLGAAYLDNSLQLLPFLETSSVNLVITSPPFALKRKKEYGNVDAHEYVDWFLPFAKELWRVLRDDGSFVLDIGGSWNPGKPTKTLYNFELLVSLCREIGFHLAEIGRASCRERVYVLV